MTWRLGPCYAMLVSVTIPLISNQSLYTQRVSLDGSDYDLQLDYNARQDVWMLNVATPEGSVVINGHPLVVNRPVFRNPALASRPPGQLLLVRAQDGDDILVDDLGTESVRLTYFTAAELESLAA